MRLFASLRHYLGLPITEGGLLLPPLSVATPTNIGLDEQSSPEIDEIEDALKTIEKRTIPEVLELAAAYFQHTPGNLIGAIRARIRLHAGKKHGTDEQVLFVLDAVAHRFTAEFAKEMQLIIDRMRGNPISGEIEEVREVVQQALTFSSDDVRTVYSEIGTAGHNDFSVDPGFLIHRIKSAFKRDIKIDRDPTPAELREVVELFRTRFEGDFGTQIDALLSEALWKGITETSKMRIRVTLAPHRNGENGTLHTLPVTIPNTITDIGGHSDSVKEQKPHILSVNGTLGKELQKMVQIPALVHHIRDAFALEHQRIPTPEEALSIIDYLTKNNGLSYQIQAALITRADVLPKIVQNALISQSKRGGKRKPGKQPKARLPAGNNSSDRKVKEDQNFNPSAHHWGQEIAEAIDAMDLFPYLAITTEIEDLSEGELDPEDFLDFGFDPLDPTSAKPGSEEKVRVLSARYAAGIMELWHAHDCYDQSPQESDKEQEFDIIDAEMPPDALEGIKEEELDED